MSGLWDLKWEETDIDTSMPDLTQEARLRNFNGSFQDVISRKDLLKTIGTSVRTDILYQARIQWTSEDAVSGDYVVINKKYSSCWIDKTIEECSSGSIIQEVSVNHSLPDGSLREEEHITFHLQLTTANKSSNTYALAIKDSRTSLSTSLVVPSGLNLFTLQSNLSRTGWYMTLDIQLKSETYGDAKYWY